jgi:transketolase
MSSGFLLREALIARRLLEARGCSVRLINARTVHPIDEACALAALRETRLVVTIEDHLARGGLATGVAEVIARHRPPARHLAIALDDFFQPTLLARVLRHEGFTGEQLAERIARAL